MENLKTVYEIFKRELQGYIKEIAEKHSINPLQALEGFIKASLADDDCWLYLMGQKLHQDYDVSPDTAYELMESYKAEVYSSICPDWNSTVDDASVYTHLNKRLVEAGFNTIPFEALDFLIDEMQQMKPVEAD